MIRFIRSAWVIARRDFTATVLSKTFLFFLLGPLFPLLFGGIFGGIGASVANSREKPVVAVVSSPADFARLSAAQARVAGMIDDRKVVRLVNFAPERDAAAQEKRLLATDAPPVQSVLTAPFGAPHLTGDVNPDGTTASQLKLYIASAQQPHAKLPDIVVTHVDEPTGSLTTDRAATGQVAQFLLFFLTLLLSTMLLSQVVEEKSNKIIEVIAAALPIDAMFIGKLFAMLAASVIGIMLWTAAGAALLWSIKPDSLASLPVPAVGWPGFLALVIIYFAMNYLLFGAVFLTIGAQASTVREVQIMSMPVTFGQMLVFGFAAVGAAQPNSNLGLAAAIFPLSSPLTMIARAAEQPNLWPHVIAVAWQILWVAVILRVGASLFRKTVLKSGPRTRWWRRTAKA
jgi:ABC-2 type transport system permease protein